MSLYESEKRRAAAASLDFIEDGMAVGLGTGTTAAFFIRLLGERVSRGLTIRAIPSSRESEALAAQLGIPLSDFEECGRLDVTVDGADEVDDKFRLIKGGGGALLREKIVAAASDRLVIIVDSRKPVKALGRFPLPVEVVSFGWQVVETKIRNLGANPVIRKTEDGGLYRTDQGNHILDCAFGSIEDPEKLSHHLKAITGVVDHGLFIGMTDVLIVGYEERVEILKTQGGSDPVLRKGS